MHPHFVAHYLDNSMSHGCMIIYVQYSFYSVNVVCQNSKGLVLSLILNGRLERQSLCLLELTITECSYRHLGLG